MCRPAIPLDTSTMRAFEQRLHERLFGRAPGRRAPRYATDVDAIVALTERLESQGLLVRAARHGLEIEDLALRTTYFYGTSSLPAGAAAAGPLLVRAALFALSARRSVHVLAMPSRARGRRCRAATARIRRVA